MNTKTNQFLHRKMLRLSGFALLLLLFAGTTNLAAQNWVSSSEALTILKTRAVEVQGEINQLPSTSKQDVVFPEGQLTVELCAEIHRAIRTGQTVEEAFDAAQIKLWGDVLTTSSNGGPMLSAASSTAQRLQVAEDVKALLVD